ncbi:PPOX class F420-dependent oxidoreductase [Streptomyces sp. NPDC006632]|uniref:PPOX class F420-dependent oxidoreductase n=1 Tax=unclassified Streptomyces TaxID=2593676 RepID=UPI002E1ED996
MTITLNDAARELLDAAHPAVLATVNPDGSPQTSVVWVGRDGDDLLISSAAGRRKITNMERDGRVSLTVYDRADPQRYLEVRGSATVAEDLGRKVAVALAEKYEGPGAGEEYVELPAEVVRVVVRITPRRLAGTFAG